MSESEEKTCNLFLQDKPVDLIIAIRRSREPPSTRNLSRKVDTTYAHACKVLQDMIDHDLVRKEKHGRKNKIFLTEEGQEIAESLDTFKKLSTSDNTITV